jgi:hypothetical protein
MAKAATKPDKAVKKEKKTKKKAAGAATGAKAKAKDEKKARKASTGSGRHSAFEGLAKLADHPLVADLLAAGALAAVAAIAEHQVGNKNSASSKMVKNAGKAAAAAMGKKLMGDFGVIRDAATGAAKAATDAAKKA